MSLDDPFRHTLDQLAARVLDGVTGHLKTASDELAASAEADRARAVADAWQRARNEAEQQANQRVFAAEQQARDLAAAAEQRLQDALRSVDARVQEATAAVEARANSQIAFHESRMYEVESRAKEDVLAAESRAHDAVNRAEALAREALAAAESRARETLAAMETESRSRVDAADARAVERIASLESRAVTDRDEAVARVRSEAASDRAAAQERLVAAIRALDAGQSLSDIMNTLVRCACAEAPRVGIFVREGSGLRSWKLIGFEHLSQDSALDLSLDSAGIIGDAMERGDVVSSGPAFQTMAPAFAQLPPGRMAIAVPLVISRDVIGVLYGDAGSAGQAWTDSWTATIEILGRHATRALEVLTASKLLAQTMASRTSPPARTGGFAGR